MLIPLFFANEWRIVRNPRARQNIGFILGSLIGFSCIVWLASSHGIKLLMPGPYNSGHEELLCQYCHLPAEGTIRQQIQANMQFLLNKRTQPADFGRMAVSNEQCLNCHPRPDDRHPVFRFFEPRFKVVRDELKPHTCNSCHQEHHGKRVTLKDPGFCRHCHEKTQLKQDPVTPSHAKLIQDKKWSYCLRCHDFHGNYIMSTEHDLTRMITDEKIIAYFRGGQSPYSMDKYKHAFKEPPK